MGIKKYVSALMVSLSLVLSPSLVRAADKTKVQEFTLVAKQVSWEILPGVKVKAMTFNGMIPGPEIRVQEGDRVRIKVRNELPEPTSVHWHGLDVPFDMDGVPGVNQAPIMPGKEFTYEFVAKPAGVRFYHAHYDTSAQMTNAMHGAFIVEPAWPSKDKPDRHYILFLSEWNTNPGAMSSMEPNYYTINGKAFPADQTLPVKKGDKVRITLINVGTGYHPMHLHGHQFKIVAEDGNEIPPALQLTRNTVPLLPGESYDIEFTADNPGIWAFHCHEVHHVTNNGMEPGGLLALVVYEGYESAAKKALEAVLQQETGQQ